MVVYYSVFSVMRTIVRLSSISERKNRQGRYNLARISIARRRTRVRLNKSIPQYPEAVAAAFPRRIVRTEKESANEANFALLS